MKIWSRRRGTCHLRNSYSLGRTRRFQGSVSPPSRPFPFARPARKTLRESCVRHIHRSSCHRVLTPRPSTLPRTSNGPPRLCIRKLHPAVSRQTSHCYFPVAFVTQPPVTFRMSLISLAFVTDGICGIHRWSLILKAFATDSIFEGTGI